MANVKRIRNTGKCLFDNRIIFGFFTPKTGRKLLTKGEALQGKMPQAGSTDVKFRRGSEGEGRFSTDAEAKTMHLEVTEKQSLAIPSRSESGD